MDALLLVGAVGAAGAALVHGVVGHRWLAQQLGAVELPSSSLFGDADVSRRVLRMTWHVVTAVFAVTAVTLLLMSLDVFGGDELLRFLCALHVVFLLLGAAVFARRPDAWLRPVPPVFVTCMGAVAVTSWLASR